MSQFYVDVPGLTGLHNQLVRASGDASDTLDHTRKHCDIDFPSQGLLMMFLGPHKYAYENVTGALTKLSDLAGNAATQVNRAQLDYARADGAAAAHLDSSYPGRRI